MYNVNLPIHPDYPPLYNNPELTALVAESLRNIDGDKDIKEIKEFPALAPQKTLPIMRKNSQLVSFISLALQREYPNLSLIQNLI